MDKTNRPVANAAFGVDHPLIAVNDIDLVRQRLLTLGFNMTPVGEHPWGTSTSLAVFDGCLLEIVGIHDATLIDTVSAGDFRFGRHVHDHLLEREGVALTALHSTDAVADMAAVQAAGLRVSGHLQFGRDVVLPDGRPDRTRTTLAILPDTRFPRLSLFLCQQHRPDLIYVPQWMTHPNTVAGIAAITIKAGPAYQVELRRRLEALYGASTDLTDGFVVSSANGLLIVQTPEAVERDLGRMPDAVSADELPAIVGMEFHCDRLDILHQWVSRSGFAHRFDGASLRLDDATAFGNTWLSFKEHAGRSGTASAPM